MKTKFIKVTDEGTEMYFLILQLQESDEEFLERSRVSSNLKIILNLSDKPVTCISGYDLNNRFGNTIDSLGAAMLDSGTVTGLKEIVHNISDISRLPDELNVKNVRWACNYTNQFQERNDELEEIVDNICSDDAYRNTLEKAIFKKFENSFIILLIEKNSKKVIYESTIITTAPNFLFKDYIWIPLKEVSDIDFIEQYQKNNYSTRIIV